MPMFGSSAPGGGLASGAVPNAPAAAGDPSFWQTLGQMFFHGGSPADASLAIRQREYQASLMHAMPEIINSLPDDQRRAAMLNFPGFVDNYEKSFGPQSLKEGESVQYGGPGGAMVTAPKLIFDDKSGVTATQGPGGTVPTGQFGGDIKAENGLILSGRTGPQGAYSTPQAVAPGTSLYPFTPAVAGGGMIGSGAPAAAASAAPAASAPPASSVADLVAQEAQRQGVDPNLALGVWRAEGGISQPGVRSPKGAIGPMQLMPGTAQDLGIDPTDMAQNVRGGVAYLKQQLATFKDPRLAVAAYNAGPGAVQAHGGVPPFPETQQYVSRALAPPVSGAGVPQQAAAGALQPLVTGRQPRVLTPEEAAAKGYAPGSVVEEDAAGHDTVSQAPQYNAEWARGQRELFAKSKLKEDNDAAQAALTALTKNAGTLTGPAAYSILDTFARTINPGAVARQGTLQAIEESLGLPGKIMGAALNAAGKGPLPLHIQQQLVDAVTPFANAHWEAAKRAYDANVALGAQHGFQEGEMTMPLGPRPERVIVTPNGSLSPSAARAQQAQVIAQARQAIAKGAPRAAVLQRLQQLGVNTAGL